MKSLARYVIISLIAGAACLPASLPAQGNLSFQVFYDNLSPHGYWVDYPNYGYVWIPNAGPDFIPYATAGYWAMTSYGWTWVSNYSWGWAPFHYGRWWYDSFYGWFWVPDNVWGPAWVIWRTSPGYYGWAPLGPNISITFAMGGGYIPPVDYWCYAPSEYLGRPDINNYYGPRKSTSDFINTSSVINNTYVDNRSQASYIAGPKQDDVEKATGKSIKTLAIKEHTQPTQEVKNNVLQLYRPVVSKEASDKAKPAKVSDKKDVPPVSERKDGVLLQNNEQPDKESGKKKPVQKAEDRVRSVPQGATEQNKNIQRKPVEQPRTTEKAPVKAVEPSREQKSQQQKQQTERQPHVPVPAPQQIPKQETQKAVAPSEHQINRPVEQNINPPVIPPPVQQQPPPPPPRMDNPPPARPVPPRQDAPGRPH
ncbi:MAG: DUF6600 domain-containing protein [Bacteroidia bacterium]